MRFQTGAGYFYLAGFHAYGHILELGIEGIVARAVFEELFHAQVIQQVTHAIIRVQELDAGCLGVLGFLSELDRKPGQDPKERAVHDQTVRKVQEEYTEATLSEFVDDRLEIDTNRKVSATTDLDAGHGVHHRYRYTGGSCAHTTLRG